MPTSARARLDFAKTEWREQAPALRRPEQPCKSAKTKRLPPIVGVDDLGDPQMKNADSRKGCPYDV